MAMSQATKATIRSHASANASAIGPLTARRVDATGASRARHVERAERRTALEPADPRLVALRLLTHPRQLLLDRKHVGQLAGARREHLDQPRLDAPRVREPRAEVHVLLGHVLGVHVHRSRPCRAGERGDSAVELRRRDAQLQRRRALLLLARDAARCWRRSHRTAPPTGAFARPRRPRLHLDRRLALTDEHRAGGSIEGIGVPSDARPRCSRIGGRVAHDAASCAPSARTRRRLHSSPRCRPGCVASGEAARVAVAPRVDGGADTVLESTASRSMFDPLHDATSEDRERQIGRSCARGSALGFRMGDDSEVSRVRMVRPSRRPPDGETRPTAPLTHIAPPCRPRSLGRAALSPRLALAPFQLGVAQRATTESWQSAPITGVRYEVTADGPRSASGKLHVVTTFGVAGDGARGALAAGVDAGCVRDRELRAQRERVRRRAGARHLRWDKADYDTLARLAEESRSGDGDVRLRRPTRSTTRCAWTRPTSRCSTARTCSSIPKAARPTSRPPWWSDGAGFPIATGMARADPERGPSTRRTITSSSTCRSSSASSTSTARPCRGRRCVSRRIRAASFAGAARTTAWEQIKRSIPPEVLVFGEVPWDSYDDHVDHRFGRSAG